ncbi:MAG: 4Fe-4S binding protein, partial [Chloroflexi bacterium]|nr:4Fe-4S binding protein [Chloroflexota bacterium]
VLPFSCSTEAAEAIGGMVTTHELSKVVLAACSCCSIDQVCYSCTYQRVRCKDNLGVFASPGNSALFEFVNIREQCAWTHRNDPQAATVKATAIVSAAVAGARAAAADRPVVAQPIERSALILGDGAAVQTCRVTLSRQGIAVRHIEGLPDQVRRTGGQYTVTQGDDVWRASALTLAPRSADEVKQLLTAFGHNGDKPRPDTAWGGLDTLWPGVYYCGPDVDPTVAGAAAAARVAAWLGRAENRRIASTIAFVDPSRCRACGTCVEICEFAPELVGGDPQRTAWIDALICIGCGTCAAHCPSGAITAGSATNAQLEAMLSAMLA